MHMQRFGVDVKNHSQSLFHLIQRGRVSQSNPQLINRPSFPRQLTVGIPNLCLLSLELQVGHYAHLAFTRVWNCYSGPLSCSANTLPQNHLSSLHSNIIVNNNSNSQHVLSKLSKMQYISFRKKLYLEIKGRKINQSRPYLYIAQN